MSSFSRGQVVGIPCRIQNGAFANEYLVSINTEEGMLSGFADVENVRPDQTDPSRGTVRATIVDVRGDAVKVRIHGSFFTIASGTTLFSSNWASTNLQEVPA